MLNTIQNLQFALDGNDQALWTVSSGNVEGIESLENTGISAVQTTAANQPIVDGSAFRKEASEEQYLILPGSIYGRDDDSLGSWRFIINQVPSETFQARGLFGTRSDDAGPISVEVDNLSGNLRVRVITRFSTIASANISVGVPVTLTHTRHGSNNTAKVIIDQGGIDTGSHDRPSSPSSTYPRFFARSFEGFSASITHSILANHHASDELLQEVHDYTMNEFQEDSGITLGPITKEDGITLVPEGSSVHHMYADDTEGTNEQSLELKYTDINGEVELEEELPAGKVRFIRVAWKEVVNGEDHYFTKVQFFND